VYAAHDAVDAQSLEAFRQTCDVPDLVGAAPPQDFAGPDVFVVLRTSEKLEYGDGFRVTIPAGGLWLSNGQDVKHDVTTKPIYANVSTFLEDLAAGSGGITQRNVPIPMLGIGMADSLGESVTLDEIYLTLTGTGLSQTDLMPLRLKALPDGFWL